MTKKSYLMILAVVPFLYGCNFNYDTLSQAMNLAGDNRGELEAVLDHYADDAEKLAAAKFLISNMPGHYSYSHPERVSQFNKSVDSFISNNPEIPYSQLCDSLNALYMNFGIDRMSKVSDCELISSEYLIANIEDAFERWHDNPWLKHLDFDQFCEYVLPYKVDELQPLNGWKNDFINSYRDLLEDLRYCDLYNGSAYMACKTLNNAYKRDLNLKINSKGHIPVMDVSVRIKVPSGVCSDFTYITSVVFRSVGLPVTQDRTPHWANIRLGHSWNVLLAQNGKTITFVGMFDKFGESTIVDERPPKVFRKTFSINDAFRKLNSSGEYIPPFFRNICQKDVTQEYIDTSDIEIRNIDTGNKYAYLCVYGDNDWTPVDFAEIKSGCAIFKNVAKNVIYLPVVYSQSEKYIPVSDTFLLKHNGEKHFFNVGDKTISASLYRKSPALRYTWDYAKLAKGGEFEASNDPDFIADVHTVYEILTGYAISGDITVNDSIPECRYWRYINRKDETYCSMADIAFYKSNEKEPEIGEIIGTDGSWEDDPAWSRENLFDGNPLTSYCAPRHNGCWVGMDFGKPIKISRIIYTPRADGNMVEPGDCYELFYWNNKWVSLGKKEAITVYLKYDNIPDNAILLLRNRTKGVEERIFVIDSVGNQVW